MFRLSGQYVITRGGWLVGNVGCAVAMCFENLQKDSIKYYQTYYILVSCVVNYYPKSREICEGCECLYVDDGEESDGILYVFHVCTAKGSVLDILCDINKQKVALRDEIAELNVKLEALERARVGVYDNYDSESDGQPDEAKEWEDFGERYSDEYDGN